MCGLGSEVAWENAHGAGKLTSAWPRDLGGCLSLVCFLTCNPGVWNRCSPEGFPKAGVVGSGLYFRTYWQQHRRPLGEGSWQARGLMQETGLEEVMPWAGQTQDGCE